GLFLHAGWDEDEAAELVFLAAHAAGHEQPADRKQTVRDTYRRHAAGQPTQGIPSLKAYLPDAVVDTLARWCKEISPQGASGTFGAGTSQGYGGTTDWPSPEDLPGGLLAVPELKDVMLPVPLREWVVDIAARMQCPLVFPAVGAIVALASLVGRTLGIRPKQQDDWQTVPNLWGA